MQITPGDLLAEAGRMALELRLKDQALEALAAENKALREKAGELDPGPADASDQTAETT